MRKKKTLILQSLKQLIHATDNVLRAASDLRRTNYFGLAFSSDGEVYEKGEGTTCDTCLNRNASNYVYFGT